MIAPRIELELAYKGRVKIALIDPELEEEVKQYSWLVIRFRGKFMAYAVVSAGYKYYTRLWLHRFVVKAGPDQRIKFVNKNSLDCRRKNLITYEVKPNRKLYGSANSGSFSSSLQV
jgi:hypothetical protein